MNKRKPPPYSFSHHRNKKLRIWSKSAVIFLSANNNLETIYLNESKTSFIKLVKLSGQDGLTIEDFEDLWNLKPQEKAKMKIAGRVIECPRYSKSYLQSYKFSGLDHEADLDMPERIVRLLDDFAKKMNPDLNQTLINWYESDGSIGKHSDDERHLKPNSEIFSFSFGPGKRNFILEPKRSKPKTVNEKPPKYKIQLEHNTLVIMCGECQTTHCHSVPKMKELDIHADERRINVTFRCFK